MKGFVVMSENHRKKKNEKMMQNMQGIKMWQSKIPPPAQKNKKKEKPKPTNMDEHETSLMLFRSPNHSPTRGTWFLVDPAARCDWRGSRPHLEGEEPWEGGVYWSTRSRKGGGEEKLWTHRFVTTVTWSNTHWRKKKIHVPQKLGSSRSHLDDATRQPLTFHHRRHGGQTVPLYQPARHPRGSGTLPWRHDDSQAIVTAAAHGSAPGIYHETDQEAEKKGSNRTWDPQVSTWSLNCWAFGTGRFSLQCHADTVRDITEYLLYSLLKTFSRA